MFIGMVDDKLFAEFKVRIAIDDSVRNSRPFAISGSKTELELLRGYLDVLYGSAVDHEDRESGVGRVTEYCGWTLAGDIWRVNLHYAE